MSNAETNGQREEITVGMPTHLCCLLLPGGRARPGFPGALHVVALYHAEALAHGAMALLEHVLLPGIRAFLRGGRPLSSSQISTPEGKHTVNNKEE